MHMCSKYCVTQEAFMVLWEKYSYHKSTETSFTLPSHKLHASIPLPLPFSGHFTSCTKLAPETINCLHMLGLLPPPTTDKHVMTFFPVWNLSLCRWGFIFWTAGGPVETTTPPAVLGDLPWRFDASVWIPCHLDSHPDQSLSRCTDLANW